MATGKRRVRLKDSAADARTRRNAALEQQTRHSLQVHQVELEMQNEELRRIQADLDSERKRYFDLYHTAPVGYCTFSAQGLILESNDTAAQLLDTHCSDLVTQAFHRFIQSADQDVFYLKRKRLVETGNAQSYELRMTSRQGAPLWVRLITTLVPAVGGAYVLRIVMIDIEDRKRVELALQSSEQALRVSERQMVIAQRISGTGSWTYNVRSNRLWGSAEALRIFGYPAVASDIPAQEIEACMPEGARVHAALLALIVSGQEFDLECAAQPVDGSTPRIIRALATVDRVAPGAPRLVLGFVQDITKVRQLDETVRQLAFFDPLTGLPNRRLFMDRLSQAITAGQRNAGSGAIIYLDLDNFKPLNDTHGHGAGDLLLIEVAQRLLSCVRETDTVARIGGDEFVVLMGGFHKDPAESIREAMRVAEKVRSSLANAYQLTLVRLEQNKTTPVRHHCSASIGVTVFNKDDRSQEDILHRGDSAMYAAKEQGRNRVQLFQAPAKPVHGP